MAADGLRGRWLGFGDWDAWMAPEVVLRVIPKPLWPALLSSDLLRSLPLVTQEALFGMARERCVLFVADGSLSRFFWCRIRGCMCTRRHRLPEAALRYGMPMRPLCP